MKTEVVTLKNLALRVNYDQNFLLTNPKNIDMILKHMKKQKEYIVDCVMQNIDNPYLNKIGIKNVTPNMKCDMDKINSDELLELPLGTKVLVKIDYGAGSKNLVGVIFGNMIGYSNNASEDLNIISSGINDGICTVYLLQ